MLLTSCTAETNLHRWMQATLIVEKMRQMMVDIWHLKRFPVCKLL